jgi:hypothetical protein
LDFAFFASDCIDKSVKPNPIESHKVPRYQDVTKIINQVKGFARVLECKEWVFVVSIFEDT